MERKCISSKLIINRNEDGRYSVFSQVTKKTYMIGENEYTILSNLDGINTVEDLGRISRVFTKEHIEKLLIQFERLGFIEGNEGKRRQSIWRMSKSLINPNKFIKTNSFLTKITANFILWFSAVLLVAGILSVQIKGANIWSEFAQSIRRPATLVVIPVFILVLFFHELGHTILARFYGVNVPEMGVVLYFFMPGAYVNLTAVNLLKSKRKRIMIYLGGILVNSGLSGISFLLYTFVSSGRWFFLWFAFENLLYIVTNLFVYLKMDGYLILQEMLSIRSVMEKAYQILVTDIQKRVSTFRTVSPYKIIEARNEREGTEELFSRAVLKTYSVITVLFIPMLIIAVLLSYC